MRNTRLLFLFGSSIVCLAACGGGTGGDTSTVTTTKEVSKSETVTESQQAEQATPAAKDTDSKWEVGQLLVQGKPWGSENQPVEELQKNVSESEKTPDMRLTLALKDLAGWYRGQKKYEHAEKTYKRITDMEANRLGVKSGSLPDNDLGVLYTEMGKQDEAEDQFKQLIKRFEGAGKPYSPASNDVEATIRHNYSYLLSKLGRADEAKTMEDKADALMAEKKAAIDAISQPK